MPSTSEKLYRVLMVTGVYPTKELPHLGTFIKSQVESLIAAGVEIELIHPKPGRPVPVRYASAMLQVFLKTLTGRFDLVHGHYGLWCLAARLQWMAPVVASFMGSDLQGMPDADGGSLKKAELVVSISRWLSKRVDAVIVKSERMKKVLPPNNIYIIPNGVDFELFHPMPRAEARSQLGWEQDRYYVLFTSDPQNPNKNFSLAQAAIECLGHRGIVAELVVIHGLPQTQVVQYINASSVVILPSILEGSPNIVKETMVCNVPVVSTDVGDVLQVIGRTKGCKVCSKEPEAVADALEEALLHVEPTTGRADIAHLESSVVAQQVIAVYAQVKRHRRQNTRTASRFS